MSLLPKYENMPFQASFKTNYSKDKSFKEKVFQEKSIDGAFQNFKHFKILEQKTSP